MRPDVERVVVANRWEAQAWIAVAGRCFSGLVRCGDLTDKAPISDGSAPLVVSFSVRHATRQPTATLPHNTHAGYRYDYPLIRLRKIRAHEKAHDRAILRHAPKTAASSTTTLDLIPPSNERVVPARR